MTKPDKGIDFKDFDDVDPFEIFEQFFGNKEPKIHELAAMKMFGIDKMKTLQKEGKSPLAYVRAFQNGVEPHSPKQFRLKTLAIIQKANEIISQYAMPLTVRQIYYRFVGEQLIENSLKSYKSLANILCEAREQGYIHYSKIIDRNREPIKSSSWSSPKSFFDTVKESYRKDINENQPNFIEVWIEKQALTGVFEPITIKYDLTLCVGRGYPSLSALYEASKRLKNTDKDIHILYFGDFDPSGEDIYRDIQARLSNLFSINATFEKVSLTAADITQYNLPPAPAKRTDTRAIGFIQTHGDMAVELDALPPDVLTQKIISSVENKLDMTVFS